jgi:hypothetical protein
MHVSLCAGNASSPRWQLPHRQLHGSAVEDTITGTTARLGSSTTSLISLTTTTTLRSAPTGCVGKLMGCHTSTAFPAIPLCRNRVSRCAVHETACTQNNLYTPGGIGTATCAGLSSAPNPCPSHLRMRAARMACHTIGSRRVLPVSAHHRPYTSSKHRKDSTAAAQPTAALH